MRQESLDKLNFDHVRQKVADECACALGKRLARSILPTSDPHTVRAWLDQGRQFAEVAEEIGPPPMAGVHDIRPEIQATSLPAPLEGDALARVAETLAATATIRTWFSRVDERAVAVRRLGERIDDFSALARLINDAVDSRGRVLDHASPKLRTIRRTIDEAHDRINIAFDRILRQTSMQRMLQYSGTTFHHDRVVLPLRAEHRGRIPGIIHRTSDSGATLFVEPSEVVEINNTIIRLKEEEQKEITRILRELTSELHRHAREILATLGALALLDLNRGKWLYGRSRACVFPIVSDDGALDLVQARHPVLIDLFAAEDAPPATRRSVVPVDVRLGIDFDALVITGPNTGGKTVVLKTVGLCALMAQAGLPIPADEGSRIPVYKDIFVDIGDEQSLHQSLSTFSSHLSNQLDILRRSGPRTLVLIDELGAGTDPDEGAAIGRTVIEELLRQGARILVTTHLSSLKAIAYAMPRVDNASVEFDVATLRPAYRLLMGEPGNSNALIIAERLGMNTRLVQQARSHLDERHRALDQAIRGTLRSRREAEEALKTARRAALEADRARKDFEDKQIELELQREAHEAWSRWVSTLKGGETVYVRSFEQTGRLVRVQLHKQSALVAVGAFEVDVPLSELSVAPAKPG